MRPSKVIDDFYEFNFIPYKLPIIVVYDSPADFPGKYVGRLWDVDKWTKYAVVRDSLQSLHETIPPRFYRLERQHGDDPVILETWL